MLGEMLFASAAEKPSATKHGSRRRWPEHCTGARAGRNATRRVEVITGLKVQFSLQSYMNLSANDRSSRLAGQL